MLHNFFAWWKGHLLEIPPISWLVRRSAETDPDGLLLTLTEVTGVAVLQAAKRRRQKLTPLGRFAMDSQGTAALRAAVGVMQRRVIQLIVPPHLLLERQVSLPLAAESKLETALQWEMDRLTPFAADAVLWHWQVLRRDRQLGTVLVALRLVPKASVETVLSMLAKIGLTPSAVVSAINPNVSVPLSKLNNVNGRRVERLLMLITICTLLGAIALPFLQQEQAFHNFQRRFALLRPEVDAAEAFRKRLMERTATDDVLAQETARVGQALQVLSTVTEVLPDDTYLSNFSLSNRTLTLTGLSSGAAKLIPLLATDPAILSPVFAAPVTRNEATKLEAFSIRAEARR